MHYVELVANGAHCRGTDGEEDPTVDLRGFKVHIALLTLIVTFAVLVGAGFIYRQQHLVRPLERDLAAAAPVASLKVSYDQRTPVVDVVLGPVDDLAQSYQAVDAVVRRTYGAGQYRLLIGDDRTAALTAFGDRAELYLWQAAQQGNYVVMADAVAREAAAAGLTSPKLSVSADNVFLQVADGANHHLYLVIPRQTGGEGR
jgi:hypothetical protein